MASPGPIPFPQDVTRKVLNKEILHKILFEGVCGRLKISKTCDHSPHTEVRGEPLPLTLELGWASDSLDKLTNAQVMSIHGLVSPNTTPDTGVMPPCTL